MNRIGNLYQYRAFQITEGKWVYEIYLQTADHILIRDCKEWFDSTAEASFAAIGHITLLEKGEG